MKLGAEPKKLAVLAGILLLAGVLYWMNKDDTGGPPRDQHAAPAATTAAPTSKSVETAKAPPPDLAKPAAQGRMRSQRESSQEFRPTLKPKRPEDRPDPTTVDPTLQLTLLARLKNVKLDGGSIRSLFDFAAPPVPKAPDPGKIKPGPKGTAVAQAPPPLVPPPSVPPGPPPKPPAPPIPLKFYGFIANPKLGTKKAFFLEGEEIYFAIEGETVKKRYKVVRIGINSVVMEDTEFKSQQTLPLEEPPQSS